MASRTTTTIMVFMIAALVGLALTAAFVAMQARLGVELRDASEQYVESTYTDCEHQAELLGESPTLCDS
jgi:hypothetical protein